MSRAAGEVCRGIFGIACVAAAALAAVGARAAEDEKALAGQILAATGVKGGLIVHVGCGQGKLTAALRANDSYMVQGLDADTVNVDKARQLIQSLGCYGPVTVERLATPSLPYTDNMVNLLVSENLGAVPMDEVMRVLSPNGVAYIKQNGQWQKTVKPRPKEIDDWTHYLHDASNNAVGHDSVVGPPRRMQWVGSPLWSRHHDHMESLSALVSANGRIFYIFDEGPTASIQLPSKWFLIARDAFNGTVLWKRPIPLWHTQLWPAKSGPAQIPRRLVAAGDTVYVTLGLDAPVTALNAATGQTIRTYEGSNGTEEMIYSDGVLFLQISDTPTKDNSFRLKYTYTWANTSYVNKEYAWKGDKRRLPAVQADTGRVLWEKEFPVAPMTLTADGARVYFYDGERVVCLNRANGQTAWQSAPITGSVRRGPRQGKAAVQTATKGKADQPAATAAKASLQTAIDTKFAPVLLAYQDVVLFTGLERQVTGLSAKDGHTLWSAPHSPPPGPSPQSLLVANGLVWSGAISSGKDKGVFTGRDPRTGKTVVEFPPDVDIFWFHHRCYRPKATDSYLLPSRTGIEFVDLKTKSWDTNHWVRGACLYGIMPCNGLVYAPPHPCACYIESKLNGFCALAPAPKGAANVAAVSNEPRLERGPAYGQIPNLKSLISDQSDWPTYRHDPARSGATKVSVPAQLKPSWQANLGGRLTSVAVAGGKLFVASIDTHTLYALDANTGKRLWTYMAGGRIDSPPTIYEGRVLFGSADGWVYSLRATDGALAWRFRAAPRERQIAAYEQLESAWPVSGSVLVQNPSTDSGQAVLYCIAGRSMFLDGGLRMARLDPITGQLLGETVLDDKVPSNGENLQSEVKGLNMPVALPDILSSDGKHVFMRSQRFTLNGVRTEVKAEDVANQRGDGAHLFCTVGYLDDSWFYRTYWMYGKSVSSGWSGWFQAARLVPAGRLLVNDATNVYGYGRKPEFYVNGSVLKYMLYSADKSVSPAAIDRVKKADRQIGAKSENKSGSAADWKLRQSFPREMLSGAIYHWIQNAPPLHVRAMVLADRTLFVAGPPSLVDEEQAVKRPDDPQIRQALNEQAAALEGKKGALLWAVSAADGSKLSEVRLDAPPVWDGMAAANGNLYLATADGRVTRFSGAQ